MRTIGQVILRCRFVFLAAIAVLTVVFALALDSLGVRDDESTWMSANNQARIEYDHFKDLFGFERFIVVAYETENPFQKEEIEYLVHLTDSLGQLPYIEDSVSLSSIEETVFTSSGCFSREFLRPSDAPRTEAQCCSLDSRIAGNPFVEGTLISGDRQTLGIVLEIEGDMSSKIYSETTHSLEQKLDEEHRQIGRYFYYGGAPVSDTMVNDVLNRDIGLFMPLTLLLSSIMLFLIFRSWRCVVLPLLSVVIGMGWTFGLKALTGSPVTPRFHDTDCAHYNHWSSKLSPLHLSLPYRTLPQRQQGEGNAEYLLPRGNALFSDRANDRRRLRFACHQRYPSHSSSRRLRGLRHHEHISSHYGAPTRRSSKGNDTTRPDTAQVEDMGNVWQICD